ncbi:MAG TPA: hypothetical protein VKP30_14415 [Polyangiaceae bacterium]|nr:hypothetical protein [Polyangiaceae bacterium]
MDSSSDPSEYSASSRFVDALERVGPRLASLDTAKLRQITLNPVAAAVTVRRVLPNLISLRAQLVKIKEFEIRNLDELDVYLHAWLRAEALFAGTVPSAQEFFSQLQRVTQLREHFASDAMALVQRGRLSAESLEQLSGATGYKPLASDLFILSTLLRSHWDQIKDHTCVTPAELDEADRAVNEFITALGLRTQSSASRDAAGLVRQQAYTLFVNAYDQVRRAVLYLSHKERDGAEIAPSLFAARNRRVG